MINCMSQCGFFLGGVAVLHFRGRMWWRLFENGSWLAKVGHGKTPLNQCLKGMGKCMSEQGGWGLSMNRAGSSRSWLGSERIRRAVTRRKRAFTNDRSVKNLLRPEPTPTRYITLAQGRVEAAKTSEGKALDSSKGQKRFSWSSAFFSEEVRENAVFYESFSGRGALCNPEAIFRYLLSSSGSSTLQHIWAMKDVREKATFEAKYAKYANVRTVIVDSEDYWRELCTAKYLFNNATFPPSFTKRPEQIYTNTWHGTPLKKMGYDSEEGAYGARNILRNFCQADFLLSPNSFTTDTMFRKAYRLDGIFSGAVIEQGYPRIDHQFFGGAQRDESRTVLEAYGLGPLDLPVVVYAPTWKGSDFQNPVNEAHLLLERIQKLQEATGHKYSYLLKVHQQVYKKAMDIPEIRPYLIPHSIPANEVLNVADVLITDYSSIFFDFLSTDRPIVFFAPDREEYHGSRGVYLEELPGPVVEDLGDLLEVMQSLGSGSSKDVEVSFEMARHNAARIFCPNDDGRATKRVVDIIMRGNPNSLPLITNFETQKERILLYLGGMRNNGITTSGLNLLQNLDFDRFDISIFAPEKSNMSLSFLYDKIPAAVRQFLRIGTHPLTRELHKELNDYLESLDEGVREVPGGVKKVFDAEWQRCFGGAEFDYIVDFSGYAGFWSHILISGNAHKARSVWQHNDLVSDKYRTVNGQQPNFRTLNSQFNTYRFYDHLVSVSDELANINSMNLSSYAYPSVFTSCRNSIDTKKIETAVARHRAPRPNEDEEIYEGNLDRVLGDLLERYSVSELQDELRDASSRRQLFGDRSKVRFVTAGRLSPEKNHTRLLEAFALAYSQREDIQLIILGDGPLRIQLERVAAELGVANVVTFLGMVDNPLDYMLECDCFVLSSDYEGQPMVLLEASSLGLPIISVSFASLGETLPPERGVVVEQSAEALGNAMSTFARDEGRPSVLFDYDAYNKEVVSEFYEAIGAATSPVSIATPIATDSLSNVQLD